MPVILRFVLENGQIIDERLPAEIWLTDEQKFTKIFVLPSKAISVELDPLLETADIQVENNRWPLSVEGTIELQDRKMGSGGRSNPMQEARKK